LQNMNLTNTCNPNWNCTEWSSCVRNDSYSGVQSRTCTDLSNCLAENQTHESRVCGLPRVTMKEPVQMVLEASDIPGSNWTVYEKNMISPDEASAGEREMGFVRGYYVHFFSEGIAVHLYNQVSIYPLVDSMINMTYSIDAAMSNYRVGSSYEGTDYNITSMSEIGDPLVGDYSIAYNITIANGSGNKRSIYTICFTKWDVADVVTVEGANVSYDFLKEMAKKAESKIG